MFVRWAIGHVVMVFYVKGTYVSDLEDSAYEIEESAKESPIPFNCSQVCKMIEFLIDNTFVQFEGCLFHHMIGIPVRTSCAPLLANLFLYSYENEFLDNIIRSGHRRLARSFNLCYRYIDDLIVGTNKKVLDYLKEIYQSQLTVEKANKSDHLADYLDLTFI